MLKQQYRFIVREQMPSYTAHLLHRNSGQEFNGVTWVPTLCTSSSTERRTEQAKANLDPRVGPRVAPRVGPRVAPRVLPREHPRGLISLFSALQGLPTKHHTSVPTEGPTSGRSGFTCPVFTCSVLWPSTFLE